MSILKRINPFIVLGIFSLSSHHSFSHEGHDEPDIILPQQLGELGTVAFASSCGTEQQKAINTGVALLHHMMYAQAEKHFAEWVKRSPQCAIMYWGYSMSLFHPLWPDKITEKASARGAEAITKAKTLSSSQREADYIKAAAAYYNKWQNTAESKRISDWANSHKKLAELYPEDIDAVAFYALAQLVMASKKDPSFSQNIQAGKLLAKLLISTPDHPGAIHYTIHAYDNPLLAEKAIDAARAYDKIAPDVPHALHMPSHIFVRLGMWEDAKNWNIRSAKAALKYPSNGQTSMHYVHAIESKRFGTTSI
ncbi:MAG: hypothetical protein ABJD02_02245 [Paraglaciecola sp.]|uniref:tetratricopeptide repeat protein n=1 Tax=Paraglaciecola sp. TaxID=1920173 RepID=UPI0032657864